MRTLFAPLLKALSVWLLFSSASIAGGPLSEALKWGGRTVARKTATEGVKRTASTSVRSAASQVARSAARRQATQTASRFGRHFGNKSAATSGRTLRASGRLSDDLVKASVRMSPQNSRRLLMLSDELVASGQADEVARLLARHSAPDRVMNFLWRNKGALATSGVIATLLLNPDKTIDAINELGNTAIEATSQHIASTMLDRAMVQSEPAIRRVANAAAGVVCLWLAWKCVRYAMRCKLGLRLSGKLGKLPAFFRRAKSV